MAHNSVEQMVHPSVYSGEFGVLTRILTVHLILGSFSLHNLQQLLPVFHARNILLDMEGYLISFVVTTSFASFLSLHFCSVLRASIAIGTQLRTWYDEDFVTMFLRGPWPGYKDNNPGSFNNDNNKLSASQG